MVNHVGKRERKFPIGQLTIIEPIAMTSVFPYIAEMIELFGISRNDVSKWTGIISAAFGVSQGLTALFWGRLSDKYGRKPIIIWGLFNMMLASLVWGFSTNLPTSILARSMAGAGSGNVAILRTAVAELVPWKEFQPRAFSLMPLVSNIGNVIGPIIGGSLANPTHRKPGEPTDGSLLSTFPFAVPNMITAVLFMMSFALCVFFLKEPHEGLRDRPDIGIAIGKKFIKHATNVKIKSLRFIGLERCLSESDRKGEYANERRSLLEQQEAGVPSSSQQNYQSVSREETSDPTPKLSIDADRPPTWAEILCPQSTYNLIAYTLLGMHTCAFEQLIPVFLHHTHQANDDPTVQWPFRFSGGFGFDTGMIGRYYAFFGAFSLIFQFTYYPTMAKQFGVLKCLRFALYLYPISYVLLPFGVLIPNEEGRMVWLLLSWSVKSLANCISFPCAFILMTNTAVSPQALSSLNGLSVTTTALGRSIGPLISGQLFSYGVKHNFAILPFLIVAALASISVIPALYMVEGNDDIDDETAEGEEDGDSGEDSASVSSTEDIPTPIGATTPLIRA